MLQRH